jgi:DHA1 family bicyclomycin/chloramphenicol resistance-like MFS transporter
VFFMAGVTFGNLNALALQRMGHIAGMAASIIAALSTIAATLTAAPVGLLYNGTAIPAIMATLICSALAWFLMGFLRD